VDIGDKGGGVRVVGSEKERKKTRRIEVGKGVDKKGRGGGGHKLSSSERKGGRMTTADPRAIGKK